MLWELMEVPVLPYAQRRQTRGMKIPAWSRVHGAAETAGIRPGGLRKVPVRSRAHSGRHFGNRIAFPQGKHGPARYVVT